MFFTETIIYNKRRYGYNYNNYYYYNYHYDSGLLTVIIITTTLIVIPLLVIKTVIMSCFLSLYEYVPRPEVREASRTA